MFKDAVWLGVPRSELEKWNILEGDLTGRFAYYRCELKLERPGRLTIDISANARYRLWINERPVLSGPCKGDRYRWYYDTVDVSEYLVAGKNVLAAQVLYQDQDSTVTQHDTRAAIIGVVNQGGGHRLAVEGDVTDEDGNIVSTVTTGKANWKVYLDGSFYLKSYTVTENFGAVCEEIDFKKALVDWKKTCCDASGWVAAAALEDVCPSDFYRMVGFVKRFPMMDRPIPLMYEIQEGFAREIHTAGENETGLISSGEAHVAPNEIFEVILDAGVIKNGYPRFRFTGGRDARVTVTYFEKFINPERTIHRDDIENGSAEGRADILELAGGKVCYEPFWYRTFRFIKLTAETKDEALSIIRPDFMRTGYPLKCMSEVSSSAAWVKDVWDMCVRTLENCMMDTYMDCPYYEQMQFSMDTRLQMMFNYAVDTDVALARKALEDFHCSMIPEGLIHGKYPSCYPQIISTFSLHYIYMLAEYYEHTGDMAAVRKYFPDMDQILYRYDERISDGLVGKVGYWEFIDWNAAWDGSFGSAAATGKGPSTIINLMYAYALSCAAKLNRAAGREGMAQEYEQRRGSIVKAVQGRCWDESRGMLREGPEFDQYSQHAQAWAVVNGMWDTQTARRALMKSIEGEDVLKVSFATSYEWFRALELAGMYEQSRKNMEKWAALIELGCTSCPETPGNSRSENHAWSALPMYELIRVVAGIRPSDAGWKSVRIEPHMAYLPDIKGTAVTPKGSIDFDYEKKDGGWVYKVKLPAGLDGVFVDGSGKEHRLAKGTENLISHTH